MTDDTKRNHFKHKRKGRKSKKELFENNYQRVTFYLEPNYYEAFEKIREALGNKKGYKTNVFNQYIQEWCANTPVAEQLKYEGIKDITDSYRMSTVLLNKKIFADFEKIIKKIGKHHGKERGIKTEIINTIMETIISKESKVFGEDVKEILSLDEFPILQKLFEQNKRA